MKTDVPAVDLPNVVEQMRRERERFRARDGMGSYQELARYADPNPNPNPNPNPIPNPLA